MAKPKCRPLNKSDVRSSDLYGYIKYLLRRGFQLDKCWFRYYRVKNSPYNYLQTNWRLRSDFAKVIFRIAPRRGYRLTVWQDGKKQLQVSHICWSGLLPAFITYFKPNKPIKLKLLTNPTIALLNKRSTPHGQVARYQASKKTKASR